MFRLRPIPLLVYVALSITSLYLSGCIVIIDTSECYRNGDCKINERCVRIGTVGKCTPNAGAEILQEPQPTDITDASVPEFPQPIENPQPPEPFPTEPPKPEPPQPPEFQPEFPPPPDLRPDGPQPPDHPQPPDLRPDGPQPPDHPQPPETFPEVPQPPETFPEVPQPPDGRTAGTYELCTQLPCKTTDICAPAEDEMGNQVNVCYPKCNPATPQCPNNGTCTPTGQGVSICYPTGPTQANQACRNAVVRQGKLDTSQSCQSGLICLGLNAGADICIKLWTGDCSTVTANCTSNEKCVSLQDSSGQAYGACLLDCANNQTCPSQMQCEAALGGVCLGRKPHGPIALGGLCSTDPNQASTQGCQQNLFCLGLQGSPKGFCSFLCKADTDCSNAVGGAMTCIEINPQTNDRACVFPCSTPGQTCPAGTTCNNAVGVCLP